MYEGYWYDTLRVRTQRTASAKGVISLSLFCLTSMDRFIPNIFAALKIDSECYYSETGELLQNPYKDCPSMKI